MQQADFAQYVIEILDIKHEGHGLYEANLFALRALLADNRALKSGRDYLRERLDEERRIHSMPQTERAQAIFISQVVALLAPNDTSNDVLDVALGRLRALLEENAAFRAMLEYADAKLATAQKAYEQANNVRAGAVEFAHEVISILALGHLGEGILEANLAELRRWRSERTPSARYIESLQKDLATAQKDLATAHEKSFAQRRWANQLKSEYASTSAALGRYKAMFAKLAPAVRDELKKQHGVDDADKPLSRKELIDALYRAHEQEIRTRDEAATGLLRLLAEELRK